MPLGHCFSVNNPRLQVVTGFGTPPTWSTTTTPTVAAPVSFPNFFGAQGMTNVNSVPLSMNGVFCSTKSLCFAVGGYVSSGTSASNGAVVSNPTTGSLVYSYGTILYSTNGGTFWNVRSLATAPEI